MLSSPIRRSTATPCRPGAVRAGAMAAVVAAVLLLTGCLNEQGQRSYDLIDAERRHRGLPSLTNDFDLNDRAQAWSEHMARTGRLSHSGGGIPAGSTRVAENVGYAHSVDHVHHLLWHSSGHRANMLNPAHTKVGIGAATDAQGRVWITQIFAN